MFATPLLRISRTVLSICLVQGLVCGLAALPVLLAWMSLVEWVGASPAIRAVIFSFLIIPSYVAFALCLMVLSAAATRLTGARTPPNTEMRIADMGRPLLKWVEHMVATHVVRVLAGTLFRGSPIWTAYLRLNGARIGRRVYVNTLFVSDHSLLEFGDDVVIGADVHMSGHTVERGVVKTAAVRLGPGATIGLGSMVDIGVEVGANCQVGALSLIPKHTKLPADSIYVGVPVKRIG